MKILVFDTETTGLDPKTEDVCEFGAVAFDSNGKELNQINSLIRITKPMPTEAYSVHGISDAMLRADGRDWDTFAPIVKKWLDAADVWCGHNLEFDINMLREAFSRVGIDMGEKPMIDTLHIARRFVPRDVSRSKSLGKLAPVFMVSLQDAHRAVHDAQATGELMFKFAEELDLTIEQILSHDAVCLGKYHVGQDPFEAMVDGLPMIREMGW